jgi:L-iditol 2-dehydrogenase
MEAVVKFDKRDGAVELRQTPEPVITADQVLVEVKAAGVCGSDVHMWRERHSWTNKLPVILGHEWCGVIAQVGDRVSGFKPGDRVAVETAFSVCGQCSYCLGGAYNMCPDRKGYGALADGAFTRFVAARQQILHRIPDNVSFVQAAMTEPVCVAYNGIIEKNLLKLGDVVVIQGPGMIGLMALAVARLAGASKLVVLGAESDHLRLDIARKMGAHYTVNVERDDPLPLVRDLTRGIGADLVMDCTGVSKTLRQSLQLVRPNGKIGKIGWGPQPLDFSLDPLVGKAVTLQGSFSHTYPVWERVLGLLGSQQIDLTHVLGGTYALADWEKAFRAMEEGVSVKSVFVMEG